MVLARTTSGIHQQKVETISPRSKALGSSRKFAIGHLLGGHGLRRHWADFGCLLDVLRTWCILTSRPTYTWSGVFG